MNYELKKITSIALLVMFFTPAANSTETEKFISNDAVNLTQCRSLVNAEIGDVERTKVANIKSRSRSFTATFKVVDKGERSLVECKLARNKLANVRCIKGNACNDSVLVSEGR